MTYIIFLVLLSVTSFASIIAQTDKCPRNIQIEAKEGSKSIYAIEGGERYALFPDGNYVFMKNNAVNMVFDSYNRRDPKKSSPHIRYMRPGHAQNLPGSVEIEDKGKKIECDLRSLTNQE